DPDRVAELADPAGGKEGAVASLADAELALALEHRADRQRRADRVLLAETLEHRAEQRHRHERALLGKHRLAGLARSERLVEVLGDTPSEEALVQPLRNLDRELDELLRLAVLVADDHVLGDVDETARQVARVGGPKRGVGETLAGAVGGDEVLE